MGVRIPIGGDDEARVEMPRTLKKVVVPLVLVIVVLLIVLPASFFSLNVGEVAVVSDPITGQISGPYVGPTVGFKPPWATLIVDTYGVEAIDLSSEPNRQQPPDYPGIEVLTKDAVTVQVDVTIRYQLIPDRFDVLVRRYPRLNYEEDFLVVQMRQLVRDIISKYTLDELIEKRPQITSEIENRYYEVVQGDEVIGKSVKLLGVNVRNVRLPQKILDAINEKIAAQQRAIAAQFERQRIEELAKANASKAIIAANASATARVIEARARALRDLIIANATRSALILIFSSIPNSTATDMARIAELYIYLAGLSEVAGRGGRLIVMAGGGTPLVSISP